MVSHEQGWAKLVAMLLESDEHCAAPTEMSLNHLEIVDLRNYDQKMATLKGTKMRAPAGGSVANGFFGTRSFASF